VLGAITPRQSLLDTYGSLGWQQVGEHTRASTSTDANSPAPVDDNPATFRIGMCQPTADEVCCVRPPSAYPTRRAAPSALPEEARAGHPGYAGWQSWRPRPPPARRRAGAARSGNVPQRALGPTESAARGNGTTAWCAAAPTSGGDRHIPPSSCPTNARRGHAGAPPGATDLPMRIAAVAPLPRGCPSRRPHHFRVGGKGAAVGPRAAATARRHLGSARAVLTTERAYRGAGGEACCGEEG